ncbi:MAG: cytidylate kinase-like family protein [Chloroflexi bacterium]|nr:cytidylate kinase-like family protein [Chloroflexota bacterium]
MPVVTITGLIGSGTAEIGPAVARSLGVDYVDRMILAQAAKKIGTTVAAVAERTERSPSLGDRVAGFMRNVLERSAMAGGGADPYFGGGLDALLVREYRDLPLEGEISDDSLSDAHLAEVTRAVINELAASGAIVIAGRGANVILADQPGVLHIGLVSALEKRIERIVEREKLDRTAAERFVAENDKARNAYFKRFFQVKPNDPSHYHVMVNTDWLEIDETAELIVLAASKLTGP